MVWNVPSWSLKGDNWKIQDEATVKVGTLCWTQLVEASEDGGERRGNGRDGQLVVSPSILISLVAKYKRVSKL